MKPRLLLLCDALNAKFILAAEGTEWRKEFASLKEAMDHAAETISEETPIAFFNEQGRAIIETVVFPRRFD